MSGEWSEMSRYTNVCRNYYCQLDLIPALPSSTWHSRRLGGRGEAIYLHLLLKSVAAEKNRSYYSCVTVSLLLVTCRLSEWPCRVAPCRNVFQLLVSYCCRSINWYSGGGWDINMLANEVIPFLKTCCPLRGEGVCGSETRENELS